METTEEAGVLKVTDTYGNQLSSIRHENDTVPGVLTFTKGTEVYKVKVDNLSYRSIRIGE